MSTAVAAAINGISVGICVVAIVYGVVTLWSSR